MNCSSAIKNSKLNDIYQKGGWGQNFMKTYFFFAIATIGEGVELCMTKFPSLNFSLFNLFLVIFSIFLIFGQIEYNMASIFSKLCRFYSILVEIHPLQKIFFAQLCHIFLRGGEGVGFFIFCHIFFRSSLRYIDCNITK